MKASTIVHCRYMMTRDHKRVLEIGRAAGLAPWDADQLRSILTTGCSVGLVAVVGDSLATEKIVAFVIYCLEGGIMDITTLAVDPSVQRRHVGSQVIAHLRDKLRPNRPTLRWIVPDVQTPVHLFLRAVGIPAVNVLRGHFDGGRDGYMFVHHEVFVSRTDDSYEACSGK